MSSQPERKSADEPPFDGSSTIVYLLPITDASGEKWTLYLDEPGLAAYRAAHPPRPLEELIGAWPMSDEEWEDCLAWEDERKREQRPRPPLEEQFPELFGDE